MKLTEEEKNNFEYLVTIAKIISNSIKKVKKNERNKVVIKIASDNNLEIEFPEDRVRMGSGGVGQLKYKLKDCKIQLNAGVGRWNYANVAIISLKQNTIYKLIGEVTKISETKYVVLDTVDKYRLQHNIESECYFRNEVIEKRQSEVCRKINTLFNQGIEGFNIYSVHIIDGNEVDIRKLTFVDGKCKGSELIYKFDFDDVYEEDGKMIIKLREPIYGGE